MFSSILFALFFFLLSVVNGQVGQTVCFEGFVMDVYCIDRGTLFDNPSVNTLGDPGKHSIHCLVDVSECVNTAFEILADPTPGQSLHSRALEVDSIGKKKIIDYARQVGRCSTCTGEGDQHNGLRVTVIGDIVSDQTGSRPAVMQVAEVHPSSHGCNINTGGNNSTGNNTSGGSGSGSEGSSGSGNGGFTNFNPTTPLTTQGGDNDKIIIHGAIMLIAWGFLLPTGVIIAIFFKHRPNGLWFHIHRICNIVGLILAIAGWIIALINFDVFNSGLTKSSFHGGLGMVVMVLGILQPLNGLIRPHKENGEKRSVRRIVWEIVHRGSGYVCLIAAVITIAIGTTLVVLPKDQKNFQIGYGCIGVVLILFGIFLML
eukprot:Pgem_evm1s13244